MKKTIHNQPTRMLDFIEDLYGNFKLLNRLSQKESNEFQREVVTTLVDSKQNVDRQILASIMGEKGIEGFVLDVLARVINRSPFKNQFELNKNLSTIAENLKKQQEELQKKQKVLQRKEQKLKAIEDNLMASIKQRTQILENESLQKILKKESEIKKAITTLINQLKTKEKLITQKCEQAKANAKILMQIEQKEKIINEKLKIIERKDKELKSKDNEAEVSRKQTELQQLRQSTQRLRQSLKQANKRYKTLEMAYKKLKSSKPQQSDSIQNIQSIPKLQLDQRNQLKLDELELSHIQQTEKGHLCQQLINYIDLEQVNGKMESIKKVFRKNQPTSEVAQLQEIKHLLNIKSNQEKEIIRISHSSEEQEDQQEQEFEREEMPACLQQVQEKSCDFESLLKNIRRISLDSDSDKLCFIRGGQLQRWIDLAYQLNTPFDICESLLEKVIQLIQESSHYLQIISYLSSPKIIDFLQHIYLSYETNGDIIETATLILSRIKLKDFQLKLSNAFLRALQIRMKVESKTSFLYGNIHFILN